MVFFIYKGKIIAIRIKKKYQGRQREVNLDVVNERIRFPKLLVVSSEGKPVEMTTRDALNLAREQELDLVLISDKSEIPVAKIVDYGKFKYERKKKQSLQKKNQKVMELKQVRLTPRIGEHDLQVKMKDAKRFLEKGNKVKVSLRFRRNELNDQELGREIINRFINDFSEISRVDKDPILRGIFLDIVLEPK